MSVATSILSVVLRSMIGDKFGNGLTKELMGISINGISEKGINEITNFINSEKSQIEHILSRENMRSMGITEENIDYVVVEITDLFSWINITDEVLRQCRYDSEDLSTYLWNEYKRFKNDYIECESEIRPCLFSVAKALIKVVRESDTFEKSVLIQISNSVDDSNMELQKISEFMEDNFDKLDITNQAILEMLKMIIEQYEKFYSPKDNRISDNQVIMFKNNKKNDYIKNWNSRLFLHIDNNENPITLADAFIMPEIKINGCDKHFTIYYNIDFEKFMSQFVQTNGGSTMLITGVPGIGKTCITSWIAQKYEQDDRVIILRFRDWESEDLEQGILKAICNTLKCKKKDLNSQILVLDGFDEIKLLGKRNYLLNEFFNDINDLVNFKIIITSRPAYIEPDNFINKISLLPFGKSTIGNFYKIITGEDIDKRKIDNQNLEVLGIPVILYMAIMSNVDLTKVTSKPELYNIIFAEKGGIFDKFSEYDSGSQVFRNLENIRKYLLFLREIAFQLFRKNVINIPLKDCKVPELTFQGDSVSILEFPIKHLFEDIQNNIEFIHKTIYEFFLSEYVFHSIYKIIYTNRSEEELACTLGGIFKNNILSKEVLEFLEYRVRNSKLNLEYSFIEDTFRLMWKYGMTYYVEKEYHNIIQNEKRIFINMLELLHLWEIGEDEFIVGSDCKEYFFYKYDESLNLARIKLVSHIIGFDGIILKKANLRNAFLAGNIFSGADFSEADLTQAELSKANLSDANFESANLSNTNFFKAKLVNTNFRNAILKDVNFKNANLENANLNGAFLENVNFEEANLKNAIINSKQLIDLENKYNLNCTRIYVDKTMEILSYEEYCKRRQEYKI
jgi:hypothetical protein